jgi:hypothetical protein
MFDFLLFLAGVVLVGAGVGLGWNAKSFLNWLKRL